MSNCDFSVEIGEGLFRCSVCNRLGGKGDVQVCKGATPSKPLQRLQEARQRALKRHQGDCGCGQKKTTVVESGAIEQ